MCYSYVGRGLTHICTKQMKLLNQEKMIKANSKKSKAKVASNIVKHIFEEKGVDRRGGTAQFETGAKPLSVTLGMDPKTLIKPRKFNLANMMRLQTSCNLSDKTLL